MWVLIFMQMVLFVVLVPGVLFSAPAKGAFREKVMIHAAIFAMVSFFAYKFLLPMLEGFSNPDTRVKQKCPGDDGMYVQLPSGDCVLKTDVNTSYTQ